MELIDPIAPQEPAYIKLILEDQEEGIRLNSSDLSNMFMNGNPFIYVISIAGIQNSGKSTLLNKAFGLNFPTMNPSQRRRTTNGIDLAICPKSRFALLDMEGWGGAGQDKIRADTITSFGLFISNLLIYNIDEKQIIHESHMEVLKNMMENQFKVDRQKINMLFCIRDAVENNEIQADDEANIRESVTNLCEMALQKLKDEVSEESKIQGITEGTKIQDVLEFDIVCLSVYDKSRGLLRNEDDDMERLRDKINRMLTGVEVVTQSRFEYDESTGESRRFLWRNVIPDWEETLKTIINRELTNYTNPSVYGSDWNRLKNSLDEFILENESRRLNEPAHIDNLIEHFYQKLDELGRKNHFYIRYMTSKFKEVYQLQAIIQETRFIKFSIKRYFIDKTDGFNFYSDLISIYRKLASRIPDTDRKYKYKYLIDKCATDESQYKNRVSESLESIIKKSEERIRFFSNQFKVAESYRNINLDPDIANAFSGIRETIYYTIDLLVHTIFDLIRKVLSFANLLQEMKVRIPVLPGNEGFPRENSRYWTEEVLWKTMASQIVDSISSDKKIQAIFDQINSRAI